jgi:hypothetical protein
MKSIEERMARLLVTEQDEHLLNEQMLSEAISNADALLEANGLELKAESVDDYVIGLQDILENYELSEEDRIELQELLGKIVRGLGHLAHGTAATIGAVKGAYNTAKSAVGHVVGRAGAGYRAGKSKTTKTDWTKPPEPTKAPPEPAKAKERGFLSKAWHGDDAKPAEKEKQTPADAGIEKAAASLSAKQAAEPKAAPAAPAKAAPAAPAAKAAVSKAMARRIAAAKAERDAKRAMRKQKLAPPASPEKAPWHPSKTAGTPKAIPSGFRGRVASY